MDCSGIYAICRKGSDEHYIGSAVNVAHRWSQHRTDLNRGVHYAVRLQNTWRKHGPGMFEFVLLEEVADKALLVEREQWWLDRDGLPAYNSRIRAESNLGVKHSAESRAKMSVSQKSRPPVTDEAKAKMSAAMMGNTRLTGHKHSAETRAKMSAATRPPRTAEHRAKLSAAMMGNTYGAGYVHTAEHRAYLSATLMGNTRGVGHKHSAAARAKMSAANRARPPISADARARMSEAQLKREPHTPETRARMSATHKARWAKTREAA